MKYLILKAWTAAIGEVGNWVELPEQTAKHGLATGLCLDAKGAVKAARARAAEAKSLAAKEVAEAEVALEAAKVAEKKAADEIEKIQANAGGGKSSSKKPDVKKDEDKKPAG